MEYALIDGEQLDRYVSLRVHGSKNTNKAFADGEFFNALPKIDIEKIKKCRDEIVKYCNGTNCEECVLSMDGIHVCPDSDIFNILNILKKGE